MKAKPQKFGCKTVFYVLIFMFSLKTKLIEMRLMIYEIRSHSKISNLIMKIFKSQCFVLSSKIMLENETKIKL